MAFLHDLGEEFGLSTAHATMLMLLVKIPILLADLTRIRRLAIPSTKYRLKHDVALSC